MCACFWGFDLAAGDEQGMIEDMYVAVQLLRHVTVEVCHKGMKSVLADVCAVERASPCLPSVVL